VRPPLIDDLGRQVALPASPGRIVSLVPSLTEVVCTLGRGDRLVGVTRYCTEPPDIVGDLPKVGGTKNPDLARIIELRPEVVLVNAEENRAEDFQALSTAGLILFVSFPRDLERAAASLQRLGAVLDASEIADHIAADLRQARLNAGTAAVRVFCPIWRKPWMSFNRDTYPHDVLSCAGAHNICAGFAERYPIVELPEIATFDPEVVLLPDEPYPFAERHRGFLFDLRETSAWRNDRVHFVDGKMLFWYGPRTAQGVRYLRELLAAP
jgi:ABC-type Fe3+-hydroxamate transport system substrate-binding protein